MRESRFKLAACMICGVLVPATMWAQADQKKGTPGIAQSVATPAGYRVGPGDVLQIIVFKEPDASVPEVTVRSDGKISLPFVGEIQVQGLTPSEFEKSLSQQLTRFIREPDVTVLVKSVQSEKIYVIGAVKRGGPIRLVGSMTVLEALSEAGLDDFAKRTKIYVLRGKTRLPFNYKDVIQGKHPEQNVVLQAGDTVVVP